MNAITQPATALIAEALNDALGDPIAPKAPPENEAFALGHDARNDMRSLDENPYDGILECLENIDWAQGWADADRALDEDDDEGDL